MATSVGNGDIVGNDDILDSGDISWQWRHQLEMATSAGNVDISWKWRHQLEMSTSVGNGDISGNGNINFVTPFVSSLIA